ncbi:MAG: Gfo/Idh/MocA family oxidoreductase [Devosia nanyangense]|uniref:Gfo/Idh/MocA family oxidoreductase n=1 Tax=Devosia nanyangense TaxID=1228055 RepID=A0A933L1W5_9HYPH|nr:Gfo/Idh/MocA family oxidoreductase [Devosia nanyangense]
MPHHVPREIRYNFEYERRLKACFIGAGGHAYRNVYPTFRYAPVDLVAICDLSLERAEGFAKVFGAERTYTDHEAMLRAEKPDVVFIVTNYTEDGHVRATGLARDCVEAGAHVWMEKPTAATRGEVEALIALSNRTGKTIMTGLKKTFFPAIEKLKDIISAPGFGRLTSLMVRYPQGLPAPDKRGDLIAMQHFIDHIYHPGAVLNFLGGEIERACFEWEPTNGATITSLRFKSGAVGALHMTAGQSWAGPLERVEAIGVGSHAVVENGVKLTHYRKAALPSYGRASSWIQPEESAPVLYEPEFSLGQLYNNNMFMLGYVPEVLHFCEAVLEGRAITKGTLATALEIMKLYDFYANTKEGVSASI